MLSSHLHPAKQLLFAVSALLLSSIGSFQANAATPNTGNADKIFLAVNRISLKQAVNKIRKKTGGRILSARKIGHGNKTIYRIKVLMPNGQVRTFRVDATTGKIR